MSDSGSVAAVIEAEHARCQANNDKDWDALVTFYGDEYMHHHQNARIDDLHGEIETLRSRPRTITRSDLEAIVYGDVAVTTGYYNPEFEDGSAGIPGLHFMQVWVNRDGRWRLVKTHSAKHPLD